MKKLHIALATAVTLALSGCGGGGGSSSGGGGTKSDGTASDPYKIQKVEYTLNGSELPSCNKPYIMTGIGSNSKNMACAWICGEYEGASPVQVYLYFDKVGGIWEFDFDYVSTALPQCHN